MTAAMSILGQLHTYQQQGSCWFCMAKSSQLLSIYSAAPTCWHATMKAAFPVRH